MGKWGRAGQGKAILKDITDRNFVRIGDSYFPPGSPEAIAHVPAKKKRLKVIKTGWIDDSRNIKNKEKYQDEFIRLIEMELGLEVWPEFYFSTERLYRLDYAIPAQRIGIECDGGIWLNGRSGHSSGSGIRRDMTKGNLLQSEGWKLIRIEPSELLLLSTIDLINNFCKFNCNGS